MKNLHYAVVVSLLTFTAMVTHGQSSEPTSAAAVSKSAAKCGPVFRANKEQVTAAQSMLRTKGLYNGQATGKLDQPTRESIKGYQKDNGLRASGTLNRATLEKMSIELTDKQKAIPVSKSSFASGDKPKRKAKSRASGSGDDDAPKRSVFRATKEQIADAQKLLKTGGIYSGEESGKLDDLTRESLKKYQEAKGLKVTGTLNQVTLEKMGIALTEKQKGGDGAN